jgi:hypothetical protein
LRGGDAHDPDHGFGGTVKSATFTVTGTAGCSTTITVAEPTQNAAF